MSTEKPRFDLPSLGRKRDLRNLTGQNEKNLPDFFKKISGIISACSEC